MLFNLIPEQLSRVLAGRSEGITLGALKVNSLLYADDLILVADTPQDLQALLAVTEQWASFY
jgi:hypothetical protein